MNPRHTSHDATRELLHPSLHRPTNAGRQPERNPRDERHADARGETRDSSCATAGDDAYGCVEWFDFDASATTSGNRTEPRSG